ncbi:DUF86 domain-containing protein [Flavobacterium sp. Sd200]|uniref:HepT-like ribonuclease domain-containing protein n=1 Tax=Flavobacterium sp. Sd200 TaxID=2692211 RepID=UPI00137135D0|nr:DUF86 domain-containing protein [Flavobacterium sp. Sd200]MXN92127.1 DUF86 domain-containing protein [Flavobacterium sp. Sd200]
MAIDRNLLFLTHIIECIDKLEIITKDLYYGDYIKDWLKQDAIIRNVEVIGEAISNIDDDLKSKYPEVPWKEAKGMRNVLIHEYFKIDYDEVWGTLQEDIPALKRMIEKIIKDIK